MKKIAILSGNWAISQTDYDSINATYDIIAVGKSQGFTFTDAIEKSKKITIENLSSFLGGDSLVVCYGFRPSAIRDICNVLNKNGLTCAIFHPYTQQVVVFSNERGYIWEDAYRNIKLEPNLLIVALSNKCNLCCKYCPFHGENALRRPVNEVNMDWDVVYELTRQAATIGTLKSLCFTGRGEVFMNPYWFEMACHMLNETNIATVEIFTNGMLLTKKNVDRLLRLPCKQLQIFSSIDGLSPSDSEFWRQGSIYETIKTNLHYAYNSLDKDTTYFHIGSTQVFPNELFENDKDIDKAHAYQLSNLDWVRRDFPFAGFSSIGAVPYNKIEGTGVVSIKDLYSFNMCMYRFNTIVVEPTGEIMSCPCAFDPFVIGNIMHGNMYDFWLKNEQQNEYRKSFFTSAPKCGGCLSNPAANEKQYLTRIKQ